MLVSDLTVLIACGAFIVTQVHVAKVARRLIRQSRASWAEARDEIASAKEEVAQIKAEVSSKLDAFKSNLPDGLDTLSSQVGTIPQSVREVVNSELEGATKTLGNHFSQNLETAVAHIEKNVPDRLREAFMEARKFGGSPTDAQAKSVESRKVNQVVGILEEQVMGPAISAKAQELADFLASVGQPELADWLSENQDAITKVERRIRANPALAARLQQFQQRVAGGSRGSVVDI